ncbi:hypothetical protein ACVRIF_004951, partial [Escherichia coli]
CEVHLPVLASVLQSGAGFFYYAAGAFISSTRLYISTPYAAFFVTSVSISTFSLSVRLSFMTWSAEPATPFSFGVTVASIT